ncbi:MAG: SDR family oxidoreductase, partial [Thermomicrobiales bacterium]
EKGGSEVEQGLTALGIDACFFAHDATSPEGWEQLIEAVLTLHGRIDVLVNNAGGGLDMDIESMDFAHYRRMIALNLDTAFLGNKFGIAAMKVNGGSIINISSVGGLVGTASLPAYSAAKGGVRLLTKCVAAHCGQRGYGIRVNSVHPGLIKTAAGVEVTKMATGMDEEAAVAAFASLHPIGRVGMPDEIANGVVFLASDESSFMTGSELVIDGGYTSV